MDQFKNLFVDIWTVEHVALNKWGDEYWKVVECYDEEDARRLAHELNESFEEGVTIYCNGEEVE